MKKHAVVIGGGMGIGEAIARRLFADGFSLTIIDRVAAKADALANELGVGAYAECADITRPEQVEEALKCAQQQAAGNPILTAVNSVGIYDERRALLATDLASYQRTMNVNLTGALIFSQAVVPLLAPEASLVHISSCNGVLAGGSLGAYKISKAGLNMLVRVLAVELAQDSRRIRVNAVAPGWVDTPGERKAQAAVGKAHVFDDPEALNFIPLRKRTTVEEIAAAVSYLCSPGGASVTGQILAVDGGITNPTVC